MNHDDEAHLAVQKAREALRENRRSEARQWAERAAQLAPQTEDPWLILAAIASPKASVQFIQEALKINPNSPRAHRGMEWAMQRLREEPPGAAETRDNLLRQLPAGSAQSAAPAAQPIAARPAPRRRRRSVVVPMLLVGIGLLVCAAAGVSAAMSPALASIIHRIGPTQQPSWALASIPKPTYTPESPFAYDLQPTEGIESSPTPEAPATDAFVPPDQPTAEATDQATEAPTDQATQEPPTAEPTWSGSLSMTYVDTPSAATAAAQAGLPTQGSGHWIDVNLTQQTLYAYDGNNLMNSFLVSTGTWQYPTVTGKYHIYVKLRYTDMSGPDYFLPNVPYTMYFYQSYGLHGTYWHHNFGTPMSHGCVNLSIPDSEWLYNFASVGTLVNIHY